MKHPQLRLFILNGIIMVIIIMSMISMCNRALGRRFDKPRRKTMKSTWSMKHTLDDYDMTIGIITQLNNESGPLYGLYLSPVVGTRYTLVLYDKQTSSAPTTAVFGQPAPSKPIWKESVEHIEYAQWSYDRRALVIVDGLNANQDGYRMLVWREGEKVRSTSFVARSILDALFHHIYFDFLWSARWAPNNARLLIRGSASQGDAEDGIASLWYIDIQPWRVHYVSSNVTWAEWKGSSAIQYWTYQGEGPTPTTTGRPTVAHVFQCR